MDDAEHTIFHCPRWAIERTETNENCGRTQTTDNIIHTMVDSKRKWDEIHSMIKTIMTQKEQEERQWEET